MACTDHTADARPVARTSPKSKSPSPVDAALDAASAQRERRQHDESQRASTALAVAVLEGMLKSHSAFKQANPEGRKVGLLPFNTVQCIGLETAIDLLHQYVDTLASEEDG